MSAPPDPPDRRHHDGPLIEALASSQRLGMLGSAPVTDVIAHSEAFVDAVADASGTVVDLGSGGGVPGLVIAWRRPDLHVILVERRQTRTDHLHRLVRRLELEGRVEVLTVDAALLPQTLDAPVDVVVARSFGPPEALLGAAVPILTVGGLVVVSEPPDGDPAARWPSALLGRYSLRRRAGTGRVAVLTRCSA